MSVELTRQKARSVQRQMRNIRQQTQCHKNADEWVSYVFTLMDSGVETIEDLLKNMEGANLAETR